MNLGVEHNTSEFAVHSSWRWWNTLGKNTFLEAKKIYINCDVGGSNGADRRAWKEELQRLTDKTRFTHRGQANGIRLNTGCSAIFQ